MRGLSWQRIFVLVALVFGAGGFAGGWYFGSHHGALNALNTALPIFDKSQTGRMVERFDLAYTSEPVSIAIWEGKNLLELLAEKQGTNAVILEKSQQLQRAMLHAKMSNLSRKADLVDEARLHAQEALAWYRNV